jgi:hypothetical protein
MTIEKETCLWPNNQKADCVKCYYPAFHLVNNKCVKRDGATIYNTITENCLAPVRCKNPQDCSTRQQTAFCPFRTVTV